jgi:hypothetical protein
MHKGCGWTELQASSVVVGDLRFRLYSGNLHVHGCAQHPKGCDYFLDHTMAWMLGSREAAKAQIMVYRHSVVARITSLSAILASIDATLLRLNELTLAKIA